MMAHMSKLKIDQRDWLLLHVSILYCEAEAVIFFQILVMADI